MAISNPATQIQWQALFLQLVASIQQNPDAVDEDVQNSSDKVVIVEFTADGYVYALTRFPSPHASKRVTLSQREKEIIRLVCAGMQNKAISDVLEISQWTVATYLKRVFAKLAVSSRAEMVARVLQEDLLNQADNSAH